MPQKLFDQVQNYGKAKYLIPPVLPKDPSGQLGKKKILDIGTLEESIVKNLTVETYMQISNAMKTHGGFECKHSGTTAVTLTVTKDSFLVSNVGDSRCIIFRQMMANLPSTSSKVISDWAAESLSRDHKPNLSGESERIISMNGRIDYYKDSDGRRVGPSRVYAKDEEGPGLAMSRSLGDTVAEKLGVIATPDFKLFKRMADRDRAIVVCSDGVTEFLSNERIGDIIYPFYASNDTEGACRKLVEESTLQWIKEDTVIDDITAVVIFFQ